VLLERDISPAHKNMGDLSNLRMLLLVIFQRKTWDLKMMRCKKAIAV